MIERDTDHKNFEHVTKHGGITMSQIQDKELYLIRIPKELINPSDLINATVVLSHKSKPTDLSVKNKCLKVSTSYNTAAESQLLLVPEGDLGILKPAPAAVTRQINLRSHIEIKVNEDFDIHSVAAFRRQPSQDIKERNLSKDSELKKRRRKKGDNEVAEIEQSFRSKPNKRKKMLQ